VRDLRQDAGAVTGAIVRSGAAVRETGDGCERHRQYVRGARAIGAGDEADAAGVALAPRVEQTKSPLCRGSGLMGFGFCLHYRDPPLPV
jgi:hypothetical protein